MLFDLLALAIGVSGATSIASTIRGSFEDKRKAKERALRGPEPVCGCTHHLSFHDAASGQCHAQVTIKVHDSENGSRKENATCTCRRYIGPEPISGYYAPEITA
jgi:hypothetical protein